MSIKYIEGDLFSHVPDINPQTILICHVCNDKGGFSSGFVVPLGTKYPISREAYLEWSREENPLLPFEQGNTQFVEVRKNEQPIVMVANMVAQTLGTPHPLSYEALEKCMKTVALKAKEYDARIAGPLFGSGLAGGDFNIIEKMIEDLWCKEGIDVTIYYLPQFLPKNWTPPKGE